MSKNETKFRLQFANVYGNGHLRGKVRYLADGGPDAVEISADESLEESGCLVLIEVDSYNSTKPAVGQYVLLNQLCPHERLKTLVLVVHYYKGFTAVRTVKNLKFVGPLLARQPALAYQAFTHDSFFQFCRSYPDVGALVSGLFALAASNGGS